MKELAAYLFLVSLFFMTLFTPLAIRMGRRWRVLDRPGPRKIHQTPISLTGGWAIFATLSVILWGHLLTALALRNSPLTIYFPEVLRDYFIAISPHLAIKVLPFYAGATGIFVLGLIDDLKNISVRSRLVLQTGMATAIVATGHHPSLGFLPNWVGQAVGILWIVGITNSFNFLDGLDGLSSGIALVGALALLTIMGIAVQPDIVFTLSVLVGILCGFLRFNYHPAKIFLGSSGSLLIGFLMAMLTMQVTYKAGLNKPMPLLTPLFILAIPIYDTSSVIIIRLLQNRSIAIGDQSHFHHRLLRIGFSHRQTVAFIILIAFSVALSAVRLIEATTLQSTIILLQILVMLSLVIIAERVANNVLTPTLERRRKTDSVEVSDIAVLARRDESEAADHSKPPSKVLESEFPPR